MSRTVIIARPTPLGLKVLRGRDSIKIGDILNPFMQFNHALAYAEVGRTISIDLIGDGSRPRYGEAFDRECLQWLKEAQNG